jgi:hypothetical protein
MNGDGKFDFIYALSVFDILTIEPEGEKKQVKIQMTRQSCRRIHDKG